MIVLLFSPLAASAGNDRPVLQALVREALRNNPDILSAESKMAASSYKIPQSMSLPDPMFMAGYQNEGFKEYTLGEEQGAQWMFSVSQMFPYPGKRALRGEMSSRDAEGQKAFYRSARLKNVYNVKSLYYELFLSYKSLDLLGSKEELLQKVEEAALARYAAGASSQQEVLMAQTEKYMLTEKREMFKQKIASLEAMLNAAAGRDVNSPLARPEDLQPAVYDSSEEKLIAQALSSSPELKIRQEMLAAAEVKERLAEKDYYPDFTVTGSYARRGGPFMDMWGLTATVNIPLYYKDKQRQAVFEARTGVSGAEHEIEGIRLAILSSVRDNFSMLRTAERLMELYKDVLIPKTQQAFDAAVAGYGAGKGEAGGVIGGLKSLIDLETAYWGQFVEREKAIARLDVLAGTMGAGLEDADR